MFDFDAREKTKKTLENVKNSFLEFCEECILEGTKKGLFEINISFFSQVGLSYNPQRRTADEILSKQPHSMIENIAYVVSELKQKNYLVKANVQTMTISWLGKGE